MATCSLSFTSMSHHGGTAVALTTKNCRMRNPPAGRANHDQRATVSCVPASSRLFLFLESSAARRAWQHSAHLLLLQEATSNAPTTKGPTSVEGDAVMLAMEVSSGFNAALNRPATARRDGRQCGREMLPAVRVCSGTESSWPVRATVGATSSYHTRRSDALSMERRIFRNIHSWSVAGQEQGRPLADSYRYCRLGG